MKLNSTVVAYLSIAVMSASVFIAVLLLTFNVTANAVEQAEKNCAAVSALPIYTSDDMYICVTPDGRIVPMRN